mmetsp:Transcript_89469/g.253514  ORF Transcript_89469/g.253514 Transcript_89469/m.253514 type:complete len:373 (+) Transcript_89469:77-1195(+)
MASHFRVLPRDLQIMVCVVACGLLAVLTHAVERAGNRSREQDVRDGGHERRRRRSRRHPRRAPHGRRGGRSCAGEGSAGGCRGMRHGRPRGPARQDVHHGRARARGPQRLVVHARGLGGHRGGAGGRGGGGGRVVEVPVLVQRPAHGRVAALEKEAGLLQVRHGVVGDLVGDRGQGDVHVQAVGPVRVPHHARQLRPKGVERAEAVQHCEEAVVDPMPAARCRLVAVREHARQVRRYARAVGASGLQGDHGPVARGLRQQEPLQLHGEIVHHHDVVLEDEREGLGAPLQRVREFQADGLHRVQVRRRAAHGPEDAAHAFFVAVGIQLGQREVEAPRHKARAFRRVDRVTARKVNSWDALELDAELRQPPGDG